MNLSQAAKKVRSALSTRDYISELTHFHLRRGQIFATNGSLTASAPIDELLEHVVPADELNKALNILGDDANLEWSPDKLVIKKGRRRVTIQLLQPETAPLIEPVTNKDVVPSDFIEQIKKIRPFISDDASRPWALTAWLHKVQDGRLVWTATNNISVVEVDAWPNKPKIMHLPDFDCQIPNFALDFVIERGSGLTHFGHTENRASFFFDDGSQMTTQLFVQKMPEQVSTIVQDCYEEENCGFELTDDWRDAYKSIVQLSADEVHLTATSMTAGKRQAQMEVEVCSPVPYDETKIESVWNPRFLTPVVEAARFIDFSAYPAAAKFHGNGIRGLTVGKAI